MNRTANIKLRRTALALLYLTTAALPAHTMAHNTDSIPAIGRQQTAKQSDRLFATKSYENPAMKQWLFEQSLAQVALGGQWEKQHESIVPQKGDGTFSCSSWDTTFLGSSSKLLSIRMELLSTEQ